jgi:putative membrane protein
MKIPGTLVAALFFALLVTGGTPLHLSATSSPEPPANKLDDATIFAIFDEVNAADIWTARLGVKNAHSPEVRDLARAVVADHEQVQQMMRDLARKLSITPLPPDGDSSAQDHAKTIALLQGKSGADFDRAYLLHEIEFHSAAVNAVKQTLLPAIQNEEFKALVQKVLPGFEHHLAETIETAHKLGYK